MIDALFVDDDFDLAKEWSEFIGEFLNISTRAVSKSSEAIRMVRDESVRIAVIDQRMAPDLDGTTLGPLLKEIDPAVRLILLSGEATTKDVTTAYDTVFEHAVHKNDALETLPDILARQLIEYRRSSHLSLESGAEVLASTGIRNWLLQRQVQYVFVRIVDIDTTFTVPDTWTTRSRIDAGVTEEQTFTIEWSLTEDVQWEENVQTSIESSISATKIVQFKTAIKKSVLRKEQVKLATSEKRSVTLKRTISLPPEPDDVTTRYRRARAYQTTPVYVRVSVLLARNCKCCGSTEAMKAIVMLPSSRIATRQVDYLSDGTIEALETGVENI